MAKLIVTVDGREKTFDLIDDVVFIGSGDGNSLRLPAEGVAEKQLQILKVDGSYRLIDLSGAGTLVNGGTVTQHALANGDRIQLGRALIQFRGGVQPAGVAAPAAAEAPPPAATGGTRRPSRARRGAKGRPTGREVRVGRDMKRSADQRDVMTRSRVRKAGLSGPATAAIASAVVLVVGMIGYKVISGVHSQDYAAVYAQGFEAIRTGDDAKAMALFESIPPESSVYRQAQKRLEDLVGRAEAGESLDQHQTGVRLYENQIKEFIRVKVDPATRSDKYADDQPAQLRYVMKRVDRFLSEFKGHQYYPEVEAIAKKWKPLLPDGPPTFRDDWVEAEAEKHLMNFGYGYSIMKKRLAAGQDSEAEEAQAKRLIEGIVLSAKHEMKVTDQRARENITKGQFNEAYQLYKHAAERFDGLTGDDMPKVLDRTANQLAEELQRRVNEQK